MGSAEHLDIAALYELLDGHMDPTSERRAEAHLWRCDACRSLREECGALLSAVRWYGADPPRPPQAYWDGFWDRWSVAPTPSVRSIGSRRSRILPGALALAASLALLIGLVGDAGEHASDAVIADAIEPITTEADWAEDYEFFERATIAVGSVDPMSKGVVLASFAEAP